MKHFYHHAESLVSTDWLLENIENEDIRIFECTAYLDFLPNDSNVPYRVISGRQDYDRGHIDGAGFLDIQVKLSAPPKKTSLFFSMLPAKSLARQLSNCGIGNDTRVILYSRDRLVWSTRVWWMLHAIGFDSASILDGGWEKWLEEGKPISSDEPSFPETTLDLHPRREAIVNKNTVLSSIGDNNICMLNALEPDVFCGEITRYGRPGRIPGSVNVPASSLVIPGTNLVRPAHETAKIFQTAGIDLNKPTIVYCGGGIAATLDAFLLHQLGNKYISIYDASLNEWARDPSLPMETD